MNTQMTAAGYPVQSREEVAEVAPAAFSKFNDPAKSNRYTFVPTDYLLDQFERLNWHPTHAKQDGKSQYSRHIIRMSNPNLSYLNVDRDNVEPQLILDNSHNGASSAQIHIGLFRLVCTNGLVVSMPGMYTNVKFRHMGVDFKELEKLMFDVTEQYNKLGDHINDMRDVVMQNDDKEQFAVRAISKRNPEKFVNEDGTINEKAIFEMTNPSQVVQPIRTEDEPDDLWSTFNVVQERMVKGGELYRKRSEKGRNIKSKPITNAKRNVEFNRELWEVAEDFMN